jgi:hypothetical protein
MNRPLFLLLIFSLFGCSKKDEIAPMISITSPEQNQVFSTGQTVTVRATITDNEGIHMIHVIAVDNTGGHWIHSEEHVDGKIYEITKSFITNPGKTYTITIDATDHDDNTVAKEIIISSN